MTSTEAARQATSPRTDPWPSDAVTVAGPHPAGREDRRWRSVRCGRILISLGAGAALYAASPPVGWWPGALFGVAALALAVRGVRRWRSSYGLGALCGLAYLLPLLAWSSAPGVGEWLALVAAETVLFALLGPGLRLVARLPAAPLWGAGVWSADEWLRDNHPYGGLPWARLAFTQAHSPFTRLAALGGAPLVTGAVALAGLLVATAWTTGRPGAVRRPAAIRLAAAVLAVGVALAGLLVPARPPVAGERTLSVAVVQGNVPRLGFDAFRQRREVLRNHVRASLALADQVRAGLRPQPAVVLWPENSSDLDPFADRQAADLITVAATAVRAPILVGAVLKGEHPYTVLNAGLLWTDTGYAGQSYIKRHPVPFGEYLPARSLLTWLVPRAGALVPNDFLPGGRPGLFEAAGGRLGDVICFEVAYDGLVRDSVRAGAQVLVVQTNNATFGHSGETWQQLAMSRLRAVEHDRAVVVTATSGVSAIIGPDGQVEQHTGVFSAALLSGDVPLRTHRTLADRLGAWPERLLVGIGLAGLLGGMGSTVIACRRRGASA